MSAWYIEKASGVIFNETNIIPRIVDVLCPKTLIVQLWKYGLVADI